MKFLLHYKFLISALFIYLIFHSFIEFQINNLIVTPFLSTVASSQFIDLIFCCIASIVLYTIFYYLNKKVKARGVDVMIAGSLFLIIGYYRIAENIWVFTPFYSSSHIKYIDVFLVYLGALVFCYFWNSFLNHKINLKTNDGFKFDQPITEINEDLLHRSKLATIIAKRISNTANSESSFSVGICSQWGNGKTSFLNLIHKELSSIANNSTNQLIVRFNPWLNNDEKRVIYTFFEELSYQITPNNKVLSDLILSYGEVLNGIVPHHYEPFNKFINHSLRKHTTLQEKFDSINSTILETGLRLTIIIDDVDRLYKSEILEIIRLVRNSANFANTVFLIAYDRNYLVSALKAQNEYKPDVFLDKIFQVEFQLPAFSEDIKLSYLRKEITPSLIEKDKEYLSFIVDDKNDSFAINKRVNLNNIYNIRDLNRLINTFLVDYELLKGECNLIDLLNLGLLKIRFSGFYSYFVHHYNEFLISKGNTLILKGCESESENKDKSRRNEYVETRCKSLGLLEYDIDNIISYLTELFPSPNLYSEDSEPFSINSPLYVDRYFHIQLLSSNLSEVEFTNARQKENRDFLNYIDNEIEKGLFNQLINRLSIIDFYLDIEDCKKIIFALFECLKYDEYGDRYGTYLHTIIYKKLSEENVKSFFSQEKFSDFIINLLNQPQYGIQTTCNLINYILHNGSEELLPVERLINVKFELYKNFIENVHSINENFTQIYSAVVYYLDSNLENHNREHEKEIKTLYMQGAEKFPSEFLNHITLKSDNQENRSYFYIMNVLIIWGTYENFEQFIENLPHATIGKKEFMRFYQRCKEVDFKRDILFDFKEIKV